MNRKQFIKNIFGIAGMTIATPIVAAELKGDDNVKIAEPQCNQDLGRPKKLFFKKEGDPWRSVGESQIIPTSCYTMELTDISR